MAPQNQPKLRESDLYAPVKKLLERLGFNVKGEVGKADIVAVRQADKDGNVKDEADSGKNGEKDDPRDLVIVELKTSFSLTLFHQAIERQSVTDHVYIAVPRGKGRSFQKSLKNNISLCRRLGLGLITVRLKDAFTEIHLDPSPYSPRKSNKKRALLLRQFQKLQGDPNVGGLARRKITNEDGGTAIITAYRQDALTCLKYLSSNGAQKASIVAKETRVDNARQIMSDNHYGWFERVPDLGRGYYQISLIGQSALVDFKAVLHDIELGPDIRQASSP